MNEESMNEEKEKISAYLDNALSQAELEALSSTEGMSVASRYQMIGEVLRGQMSDASMIDVRLQVREALGNEDLKWEEIKQEKPGDNKEAGRKRSISDLISFDRASWFNFSGYRPLGGLAIAASVAMIMVITVTHEETAPNSNLDNSLVAESTIENAPAVSVAVSNSVANSVANETGMPKLVDRPRSYVNLDTYLAEHAEFAAQDTMQGRMPYARAVSYEAE